MNIKNPKALVIATLLLLPISATSYAETISAYDTQGYFEPYSNGDPFTEIDYVKSIQLLPQSQQNQALMLYKELENLGNSLNEADISVEDETRLMVLDRRLEALFIDAEIDYVTIDLLAHLSDEDKLAAFTLWRNIERSNDEAAQEKNLVKLDELLSIN